MVLREATTYPKCFSVVFLKEIFIQKYRDTFYSEECVKALGLLLFLLLMLVATRKSSWLNKKKQN